MPKEKPKKINSKKKYRVWTQGPADALDKQMKRKFKITTPGQVRDYSKLVGNRRFQKFEEVETEEVPANKTGSAIANYNPLLGGKDTKVFVKRRRIAAGIDGRSRAYRAVTKRIKERNAKAQERETVNKLSQFGVTNPFKEDTQMENKKYLKTKEGSIEQAVVDAVGTETFDNPNSHRPTLHLPKKYLETKDDSLEAAVVKATTSTEAHVPGHPPKPYKLPRQLKDPKKEKMVGTKSGTKVVDRSDPKYKKHPEHESLEVEAKGLPPWLKGKGEAGGGAASSTDDDEVDKGEKHFDRQKERKRGASSSSGLKKFKFFQKKDKEDQDKDPVGKKQDVLDRDDEAQATRSKRRPTAEGEWADTKAQEKKDSARLIAIHNKREKRYQAQQKAKKQNVLDRDDEAQATRSKTHPTAESKETEKGERDVGSDAYAAYVKDMTPGEGIVNPDAKKADVRQKKEKVLQHRHATKIDDDVKVDEIFGLSTRERLAKAQKKQAKLTMKTNLVTTKTANVAAKQRLKAAKDKLKAARASVTPAPVTAEFDPELDEKTLSYKERQGLSKSQFALPGKGSGPEGKQGGSYPIPDESHARNALARVSQHGSEVEKAKVRAAVKKKFPGIKIGEETTTMGRAMVDAAVKVITDDMSLAPKGKGKKAAKALYKEDEVDETSVTGITVSKKLSGTTVPPKQASRSKRMDKSKNLAPAPGWASRKAGSKAGQMTTASYDPELEENGDHPPKGPHKHKKQNVRDRDAEAQATRSKTHPTAEERAESLIAQAVAELSKKTLGSYVKKASDSKVDSGMALQRTADKNQTRGDVDKHVGKMMKRGKGISKAVDKLSKEEVEITEKEVDVKDTRRTVDAIRAYYRAKDASRDATSDTDKGKKKKGDKEKAYAKKERGEIDKDDPDWKHKKGHTGMHGEARNVPGQQKSERVIDKINRIVKDKQYEKIHGQRVDLYTASAIQQVYAQLKNKNQEKMEKVMSKDAKGLKKMADFSWTMMK